MNFCIILYKIFFFIIKIILRILKYQYSFLTKSNINKNSKSHFYLKSILNKLSFIFKPLFSICDTYLHFSIFIVESILEVYSSFKIEMLLSQIVMIIDILELQ